MSFVLWCRVWMGTGALASERAEVTSSPALGCECFHPCIDKCLSRICTMWTQPQNFFQFCLHSYWKAMLSLKFKWSFFNKKDC